MRARRMCRIGMLSVLGMVWGLSGLAISADSPIRLNQVGYPPAFPKQATVISRATEPLSWQLKDHAGKVVARGSTSVRGLDPASGDSVHIADFTSYSKPGDAYTLQVGAESSHPFRIGPSVYRTLKYDALAYFYHNRSGIAIEMPYAGGRQWTRPAGHLGISPNQGDTVAPCAPDTECRYRLDARGGWYDAGDQGKYVVNGESRSGPC